MQVSLICCKNEMEQLKYHSFYVIPETTIVCCFSVQSLKYQIFYILNQELRTDLVVGMK